MTGIAPDGTLRKMTPERWQLVAEHRRLVPAIRRRLCLEGLDATQRDMVADAGLTGLIQAAASWDESRGVPFGRFAGIIIRREMYREADRHYRRPRNDPLARQFDKAEPSEDERQQHARHQFGRERLMASLPGLAEAAGLTQRQSDALLGRRDGVSPDTHRTRLRAAVERLRSHLESQPTERAG